MKKILILGGGFTAGKRLNAETLRFERAPVLPISKDWKEGTTRPMSDYMSSCPTCGSAGKKDKVLCLNGVDVEDCRDPFHDGVSATEAVSHNAHYDKTLGVERCPGCDSTEKAWVKISNPLLYMQTTMVDAMSVDGRARCRNAFHVVAPAQLGGAEQVNANEKAEQCPTCRTFVQTHAIKENGERCDDKWHNEVSAVERCPNCKTSREECDQMKKAGFVVPCINAFHNEAPAVDADIIHTIDINRKTEPTWTWDLNLYPWPVNRGNLSEHPSTVSIYVRAFHQYDEVHAYEILEHLGTQGDAKAFFACFAEIWGALKSGGLLFASCPSWKSMWAFGDPSHTRVINAGSLVFLMRAEYEKQLGKTAMSDFRKLLIGDWELVAHDDDGQSFRFVLRAK